MTLTLSPDAVRGLWTTLAGDAGDSTIFLGECFFHTVEALVAVEEEAGIDPMPLFALRAFEFAQPVDVEHLDAVLHLGRQVTRQLLTALVTGGLVAESAAAFRLTEQGRTTLQTGRIVRRVQVRRLFHFLHPAVRYLAIHDPKGNLLSDVSPNHAPSPWEFDPSSLQEAVAQPAEWKRQHRFPQDIVEVITEPVPPEPVEGSLIATAAAVTAQASVKPQHLVVDKTQVISCALVVRMDGADAVDLTAYPVSVHGSLVRGKDHALFTLQSSGDIGQAFPELSSAPSSEQASESWLALAARNMLSEPERAKVRFEQNRLVVTLASELLECWGSFVSLALQDQLCWYVGAGPLCRLCLVAVEGSDAIAAEQLQTLRAILRLEQDPKRVETVRHVERLRHWMAEQELPLSPSPRVLANMAFRFGRYRLAYELGELEDMSDASV